MRRFAAFILICLVLLAGCAPKPHEYELVSEPTPPQSAAPEITPSATQTIEPVNATVAPDATMPVEDAEASAEGEAPEEAVVPTESADSAPVDAPVAPSEGTSQEVSEADLLEREDVQVESYIMAPNFRLKDISGKEVSLNDYRGKIVFLNFWQTWCEPCIEELPLMQKLADENSDVVVLTIVALGGENVPLNEAEAVVREFVAQKGYTFSVLIEPAANGGIVTSGAYASQYVPMNFAIGRDGKLYVEMIGPYTWDTLTQTLSHLRSL